jgi:hypothetical protein
MLTISESNGETLGSLHTLAIFSEQQRPDFISSARWKKISEKDKKYIQRMVRRKNKSLLFYLSNPHVEYVEKNQFFENE